MQATSIKQAIQEMANQSAATVIQGTVTSISPLKIQIDNDSKLVISARIAIIPIHLTDYETKIDIPSISLNGAKAIVKNSLKVGEKVHLLAFEKGKKYYILDRV